MKSKASALTPAKIQDYAQRKLASVFDQTEVNVLQDYLTGLLLRNEYPPYRGSGLDVTWVARETSVSIEKLRSARLHLQPIFDAVARAVAELGLRPARPKAPGAKAAVLTAGTATMAPKVKQGPKPKLVIEFPAPLWSDWEEPETFGAALHLHARRHGESVYHLFDAVVRPEDGLNRSTLISWARGVKVPRAAISREILDRIERRYHLAEGYFASKVAPRAAAPGDFKIEDASSSERRRLAWHLPDDFNRRSQAEQAEIVAWVRRVIISGSTDYRKYQTAALRHTYALRFGCVAAPVRKSTAARTRADTGVVLAPQPLDAEMEELLRFKTSTFAAFGMQRNGVWGPETADQKIEHFGLWFGALVAPKDGEVQGFGVDPKSLTFAMMAFPQVWDWYLQWRERRRGFYTQWEVDLLANAAAFCRETTGWLRQTPRIALNLRPVPGMISEADVAAAQADWPGTCEAMYIHARRRIKEIQRVARVHRDPFEPILPVLEAASPLGEYRKITEEILRRIPDECHHPRAAAEAVRAFLLLRIGLHTGLRQKNLRELLLAKPGNLPTPERKLEDLKCGEMRWSIKDQGWEILIPSVAFKNANSSFFGSKPFRLLLPDLGQLYEMIAAWTERHRAVLIGPAADQGTFFVKTAKVTTTQTAYCQNTFYEAWRSAIQRYGIYNPWTKRGAIEGLLPHGPHNVRDVLATHILKQTGSYEQASYAIQDTPEMVAKHYGRFLPQDKAEIAARVLNQVWQAA